MKRKKVFLALAMALCLSSVAVGITACGENAGELPEDPPQGEYTFENPKAKTDANITLDGKFDEAFWNETKTYEYEMEPTPGYVVSFSIRAHCGEEGVYFAADVDDESVNYNAERTATNNSGLEFMFAPSNVNTAEGSGYRYVVNAGGKTSFAKFLNGDYSGWTLAKEAMPLSGISLKGGGIGSGECMGYQMEVFLPKAIFGGTVPEGIGLYLGLICTFDSTETNNRVWRSPNQDQIGSGWSNPTTWILFDEVGLVCNEVIIENGGNGTVTPQYDYLLRNMRNTITIKPDDNYRMSSVSADGVDIWDALTAQEDGSFTYSFTGLGKDISFAVTFDVIPESEIMCTLSGKIIADFSGAPTAEQLQQSIQSMVISKMGIKKDVDFKLQENEVVYSVEVPSGEYKVVINTTGGSEFVFDVSVAQNEERDFQITKEMWLNIQTIDLNDGYVTQNTSGIDISTAGNDKAVLWEGTIKSNRYAFVGQMQMQFSAPDGFADNLSADVVFCFNGGVSKFVRVRMIVWGGVLTLKIGYSGGTDASYKDAENIYLPVYAQNGGGIAVMFEEGVATVYLQNAEGTFTEVLSTGSIDWLKEAQLTQVRIKKSDDVVNPLRPFELLNAKIRTNDTDIESVLDSFDVSVNADTSNASGISDLTGTGVYKFGEQVTVSFTAQSDAIVNATLNGKIIHFSKNDNTYSYTFKAGLVNNLVILTAVPNKVEGTISVTGGSYTAQEIKDGIQSVSLIAENGQVYRGTVTIDGDVVKYSVSAPDGTYTLNITTVKGFESVQSIQLTDDISKDVSLTEIEWNNVRTIDLPDLRVETDTPTAEYIASNAVSGVGDQYMIGGNFGVNLLNAAGSSGEFMIDIGLIYDNGENVHIHFTKWSVNYYFGIKDDHNKNCGQLNLTTNTDPTDYMQLYGEKGGYVFVTVSKTQVTIYLYDGSKVNQIASGTVDTISGAKLVGV